MSKRKVYDVDIPEGVCVRNGLIRWYTVYKGRDESLFIQGPSKLCAEWMGLSVADFHSYASKSKGKAFCCWTIFCDLVEPSEVYGRAM